MTTSGAQAATKEDFNILLEKITQQQQQIKDSFSFSLEQTKQELREESERIAESLKKQVTAVADKTDHKWKREGNKRQFEFNQLS